MRVKKIEWSEHFPPNSGKTSFYDHIIGETPFGSFQLEWKSWKTYDSCSILLNGDYLDTKFDVDEAKAFCDKWFSEKVINCIETEE